MYPSTIYILVPPNYPFNNQTCDMDKRTFPIRSFAKLGPDLLMAHEKPDN